MQILDLRADLTKKLAKFSLIKKYLKAKAFFENNPGHPSLNTELLEPKSLRIYSFRIDRKYRAHFIVIGGIAEVVDITLHYQ